MDKISKLILERYRLVIIVFLFLTLLSGLLIPSVKINYNLQSYMPADASSIVSLDKMGEDFTEPIPNLRIAIKDVSIIDVLEYQEKIKAIPEVKLVLWMDRFTNTNIPIEIIDRDLLDNYYKEGVALLQVAVKTDNASDTLNKFKEILPENTAYTGQLVSEAAAQQSVSSEIKMITLFAVPVALLILILSVNSWIEPLIIFLTIGVAIVINMGTNIIFGEISFITQSVSGILQLAVSLDYAIFFLHEFAHQREINNNNDIAIENAIKISSSAVISSAMTTVFGFLVLVFMRFGIGKDLGLVLSKGIAFSLIAVVFFIPAIVKAMINIIYKTTHKPFLPDFTPLSKWIVKFRYVFLVFVILAPIAFVAQASNDFTYGMGEYQKGSIEEQDKRFIEEKFGENVQIVILLPKGDIAKENILINELKNIPKVKSIQSFTEEVDTAIPIEIAPENEIKSIVGSQYSRLIINTSSKTEGEEAFALLEQIRNTVENYYDNFEMVGESVALEDMRNIIRKDNNIINFLAILSVAIVILINFKSISIPILLVLTIETSIWINLAVPYFTNTKLSFIGYLIISSIQLGATVDYAILYSSEYIEQRKKKPKKEAIIQTGARVYGSMIPPALILISAGFILKMISSVALVSELGSVLGRGAFLSLLMVMLLLPSVIYIFDGIIQKTSKNLDFVKGE